jgi:hypothetical protein
LGKAVRTTFVVLAVLTGVVLGFFVVAFFVVVVINQISFASTGVMNNYYKLRHFPEEGATILLSETPPDLTDI